MCWWNEFRSLAQQPDLLCKEPQIYIYHTSAHIVCITQIYLLLNTVHSHKWQEPQVHDHMVSHCLSITAVIWSLVGLLLQRVVLRACFGQAMNCF